MSKTNTINKDLTIIFLTVNAVPDKWAEYQKQTVLDAIGDAEVITISKEPVDWGYNIIQEEEPSVLNIYKQLLRGAKLANTEYIAVAEDDCLYPKSHFSYRPKEGNFGYNHHRWGLLTWREPVFYFRPRISNSTLIAERELVIEALEERFWKYPNFESIRELGRERGAQLSFRNKLDYFYSEEGIVFLSHKWAIDPTEQEERKEWGKIKAYEIPVWGRAEDVLERFK